MIAVLTPSRGLLHSRTAEELNNELRPFEWRWFISHGLPIPDCFNDLVTRALKTDASHLLFVEDDMHLPKGIFEELLAEDVDIALADYPVKETQHSVMYLDGEFAYGGVGLCLVKREVFDLMDPPYFRTHVAYQIQDGKLIPGPANAKAHGLQDVDFFQRTKDLSVSVIPRNAGHYFLKKPELPKYGNDTALEYEVELWEF